MVGPVTMLASKAFSAGRKISLTRFWAANWAMVRIPWTGRSSPFKANSPTKRVFLAGAGICLEAVKSPTAIGRSKDGPCFLR